MRLTEKFQGKGYIVYTDNFYTSPQLGLDLLEKNLYTTGTHCSNRKNVPNEVAVKEE